MTPQYRKESQWPVTDGNNLREGAKNKENLIKIKL
jgi:hypothetical protein